MRHLNVLKKTGDHEFAAFRSGMGTNRNTPEGVTEISNLDDLDKHNIEAALITNPTYLHIDTSIKIARHGIPMFIEKPLDMNLTNSDELYEIVNKKKIPVLIGYNMIHHPGIKTLRKLTDDGRIGKVISARAQFGTFMPGWHPEEDYKLSYAAVKSMGGGVVLTSIHEQNYLTHLFGEVMEVMAMETGNGVTGIDSEEGIEILLKHKSGIVSNIHLNFYQKPYYRNCQIIGTEGTLYWDFMKPEVRIMTDKNTEVLKLGDDPIELLNKSYNDQMMHFIKVAKGETQPAAGLKEGMEDVRTALRILKLINRN
ncbi:MAG: 1,5-anhydro-D-fructose reductase [Ignavibacteria bacterium]|nr:1,5-anhydro-D-fructose reductase [Ignavibacteria bacterium]